jgi:hypothetical protein
MSEKEKKRGGALTLVDELLRVGGEEEQLLGPRVRADELDDPRPQQIRDRHEHHLLAAIRLGQ